MSRSPAQTQSKAIENPNAKLLKTFWRRFCNNGRVLMSASHSL